MTEPNTPQESPDFSLVLGGPIFQLFRKSHLSGDGLELLHRRVIALTLIAWLPLLLFATLVPAPDNVWRFSFLRDVEAQVRFLVALPALVLAELLVHLRIRPVVQQFVDRRIVRSEDLTRFRSAIESAMRLRNSIPLEIALLVVVYTLGLWLSRGRISVQTPIWYAMPGGIAHLTLAGYWYVFVSIPVFQFLLLRWFLRLFVWFRFLWQVSRFDLNLIPTHPDRAAGLAFLGKSAYAFSPILFSQGAMLAGLIAHRILFTGANLLSFKLQIAGFIMVYVLIVLGPLLMFTPQMARAKRRGLRDYGILAQRYVEDFEKKWVLGERSTSEGLLGTGDIQSLADLGNSYSMVRDMVPVPFGLQDVSRLAAATAAPLLPLLLTIFSPDELFMRVVKIVL